MAMTSKADTTGTMTEARRVCVVYQYFEKDQTYRENLIFFLAVGYRPDVDYVLVIAGESTVEIPPRPNIRCFHTSNYGHDFGSLSDAFENGLDLSEYDVIVFLNASVRGPFLAPYYHGSWLYLFTDHLRGDTHLCGAVINVLGERVGYHASYRSQFDHPTPYSHVQSYAFALTQECFRYLSSKGIWHGCQALDKDSIIVEREIRISQEVKAKGWNLRCFLPPYNWIDYRSQHADPNPTSAEGHPVWPDAYFGKTLHPYEVVFLKTGWQVLRGQHLAFYSAIALRDRPSLLASEWEEARQMMQRLSGTGLSPRPDQPSAVASVAAEPASPFADAPPSTSSCLLVLGMHRSGTSALAGSLVLMGCSQPRTLIKPHVSNEKGFFESRVICDVNDDLLLALQSHWSDSMPLDWSLLGEDAAQELRERAFDALKQEFDGEPLFVLKDPRLCRLLPFWVPVFERYGSSLLPVLIIRKPREVALSLQVQAGYSMKDWHCFQLWLRYVLESEYATRNVRRVLISYGALLADGGGVLGRIASEHSLLWPLERGPQQAGSGRPSSRLQAFLSKDLRHHDLEHAAELSPDSLLELAEEVYRLLDALGQGDCRVDYFDRLDAIRKDLDRASETFSFLLRPAQEWSGMQYVRSNLD